MKSSVTDVTDPAKLSKLASSTAVKLPLCELTSLSFASLRPGWIFPLVSGTDSQHRAQEGCGRAGECGRRGWHHQAPVILISQHKTACPHLWEPTELLCTADPILKYLGAHVIHSSLGCLGPALQSHHSAFLTICCPGDLFFPTWLREKCRLNSALRFCLDISCSLLN